MNGVLIRFDKEIFQTAFVFCVYIREKRWCVNPDAIDFTDLGNLTYWNGREVVRVERGSWKDNLYMILPENTLDLYPAAEVIGKVEVIDGDRYVPFLVKQYELEERVREHEQKRLLDLVVNGVEDDES